MTCDERRDLLLLDAFGGLEQDESVALRGHLAKGCTICAGYAAEASAVAAQFAQSLAPEALDPAVLKRLMSRVSETTTPQSVLVPNAKVRFRWLPTLAASSIAALLAAVITAGAMWPRTRGERLLTTPDLRYVSLAGSNPQPKAHGRIFWDADHGDWHVYVFDLGPPAVGKTYELWFIGNDGRKTRAGLLDVNSGGDANLTVKVPAGLGPLAAAAVTDEPAGGADQPTGTIQLVGKIE